MSKPERLPTSLRAYAEDRNSKIKAGADAEQLGRPRTFSVANPHEIHVYVERDIRPIDYETVAQYKAAMLRGCVFPPIKVEVVAGKIELIHGYHRTLAAQQGYDEYPGSRECFNLELREFKGNRTDAVFEMLNSQESLDVDPVSRAEAYLQLSNQNQTNAAIAARLGNKSAEHVAQMLFLAMAEESVKALVREDKISPTVVINLIKEEKQGGRNHVEAVEDMIANAEATGKTKATPKHRSPAPAKSAPAFKMKTVKSHLTSLSSLRQTLASALAEVGVSDTTEPLGADSDVQVPVLLPAGKVTELLALLDLQSPVVEESAEAAETNQLNLLSDDQDK